MYASEDIVTVLIRLSVAALCGGVLGWEREARGKPAGLRTQMLVCLGSSAFALLMVSFLNAASQSNSPEAMRVDPTHMIQGVIGGLGFLGAGSIIQSRGSVKGMTTAATIWVVGGVGVACGTGAFKIAGVTVAIALAILTVVGLFEVRAFPESQPKPEDRDG